MKYCSSCKEHKPLSEFNKNKKKKDGLQTTCRSCNATRSKEYYLDNRDHHRAVIKERTDRQRIENRNFVLEHLKNHPCVDCGNKDFRVLDFDHVRGIKANNINYLISTAYTVQVIADEIEKCEVRCKNCHAIVTYERLGFTDWRSQAMINLELEKSI